MTNKMLQKFGLMYGPPVKDPHGAKEFIAEYARLLSQYSETELEAAADKIVRVRKFRTWPTIGDCIEVLENQRSDSHERNAPQSRTEPTYPEWTREARAVADKLVNCEMGRKAAREGWILSLHDYCRKNRKLPGPYETGALIESARFVDQCAAGAIDMGLCHQALARYAQEFLAKRERLAVRVLGGAA